jgi:hypothetical protein
LRDGRSRRATSVALKGVADAGELRLVPTAVTAPMITYRNEGSNLIATANIMTGV